MLHPRYRWRWPPPRDDHMGVIFPIGLQPGLLAGGPKCAIRWRRGVMIRPLGLAQTTGLHPLTRFRAKGRRVYAPIRSR